MAYERIPGYDAWKLASPPDYDEEYCEQCGGIGQIIDPNDPEAYDDGKVRCPACSGSGVAEVEGPDPDEAYERWREGKEEDK